MILFEQKQVFGTSNNYNGFNFFFNYLMNSNIDTE